METPASERRQLERFSLEIPARIQLTEPYPDQQALNLVTSNICSGGAFFHTTRPLPEGTDVKIDLVLKTEIFKKMESSNQVHIQVKGTVLRTDSKGMSICFDENFQLQPLA